MELVVVRWSMDAGTCNECNMQVVLVVVRWSPMHVVLVVVRWSSMHVVLVVVRWSSMEALTAKKLSDAFTGSSDCTSD